MRTLTAIFVMLGLFSWSNFAWADMTSTNYIIRWDSINAGGSNTSTSTNYGLRDTVGNSAIGASTSTNYQIRSGFRAGVTDQSITFSVFSQLSSSEVAATSVSSTTVSVASTTGYSVNDFIALVQDKGESQVAAIGKIASIGAGTLTVDAWKNGGSTPTINGTNDYVYRLSGAAGDLGTLSNTAVRTEIIGMNVTADLDNGYTVQVVADGKLRSSQFDIDDVTDGAVAAATEEYGGRSSDTSVAGSTFDTADTAFSTSAQPVVDVAGNSFDDRNFVTLKAAITPSTRNASYAQTLSFIASGNF